MPPGKPATPRVIERGRWSLRIVRSLRRRKTIRLAVIAEATLEIRAPWHCSEAELLSAADVLIAKTERTLAQRASREQDGFLEERARLLNERHFGGKLRWQEVRFVTNQRKRFGSCTPHRGTIRISDRLRSAPPFVLDYVLVHELAHMIEPNHSAAFWKLVNRFPKAERARGYLMAWQQLQHEQEEGR